jgi:short subunit dehydrogenase-like uncharacterized protein
MLESFPRGGRARTGGKLVPVPPAWKTLMVPFADRPRMTMTVPWGDLSTAFRSTGIGEIETYMAVPSAWITAARASSLLSPILALSPVTSFLSSLIDRTVTGPSDEERALHGSQLWGCVERDDGTAIEGTLETLEGYNLTALTSVASLARVLAGQAGAGVLTPSQAFGPRFVEQFPETRLRIGTPGVQR